MTKQIYKRTSGFTLMEIMVVIIVIAVLASVAGPMITEITESGRISATKSQLSSLRAALQAFGQDLGGLPRDARDTNKAVINQYNDAADDILGASFDTNILINDSEDLNLLGMASDTYQRRWKGPYMDGNPSDFMQDAWGGKIQYIAHKKSRSVYLHSSGPDGKPDDLDDVDGDKNPLHEDYKGDDIVLSVHRVRNFD